MKNVIYANNEVQIFERESELYDGAAVKVAELATEAIARRDRFLFVLAGGETPKPLYERLGRHPLRTSLPWEKTHVFWGDERAVPPDDPQSNFRMAVEHLLTGLPIPEANIHRIPGELGATAAAREYARQLRAMAGGGLSWPRFDLVLLGLGRDGHTASLFPGSTHPSRSGQATLAVTGSYDQRPTSRVTLTPPVFNSARYILFLVIGKGKADIVANVLEGEQSAVRYPARRIRPESGSLTWFLDQAAASKLTTLRD